MSISILSENFTEVVQDKKANNNCMLLKNYRISVNSYSLWKYEVSEAAFKETSLPYFIEHIDDYPIDKLISGQAYHNYGKKLISITVKPIKTTFIVPYHTHSKEGSLLFPGI